MSLISQYSSLAVELGEADQLLCNAHLGHGVTGIGNNLHTGQDTSWATGSHLGLTSLPSEAKRNGSENKQREQERDKTFVSKVCLHS